MLSSHGIDEKRVCELEALIFRTSIHDDDPLAIHDQLCTALTPSPTRLLPALEQATRTFCADPRYPNDPRYLKLWIAYAKHCKQPSDVFAFLSERGIGRALAAFYEEWASCCGSAEEAERILRMGIERNAQPLERLKKKYDGLGGRSEKLSSWPSRLSSEMTVSWTVDPKREVGKYHKEMIENGRWCFEEIRARLYLSNSSTIKNSKLVDNCSEGDDDDDDELMAQSINPDDLTHISVYKDTTADVRELAQVASCNADIAQPKLNVMMLSEGLNRSFPLPGSFVPSKVALGSSLSTASLGSSDKTVAPVMIDGRKYYLEKCLGSRTFVAVDLQAAAELEGRVVLRKVSHRELTIMSQCTPTIFPSVLSVHMFSDCAILVMKYHELGSLRDLLNTYDRKHQPIDNRIVLFYTRCMLKLLLTIYSDMWICNSITLDNLLLSSADCSLDAIFCPDGSGGWSSKALVLTGMPKALSPDSLYITPAADNPISWELDWRQTVLNALELLHITPEDKDSLSAQWRQLFSILQSGPVEAIQSGLRQIDSILVSSTTPSLKALIVRQEMMIMSSQ